MSTEYVIVGGGDFSLEVATYILDIGRADPDKAGLVTDVVASERGRFEDFSRIVGSTPRFHSSLEGVSNLAEKLCVIAVGDPRVRLHLMQELLAAGGQLGSVIHPSAYIASTALIGRGTIICPKAFIGPFAVIGQNCAINVHAIVGHDVVIGDCAVLSPGSDVNGHGQIGGCGFLGAGAVVNPGISIGAFSKLSAGSVLTRTVGEGYLMAGNPAKGRQMFRRP